MHLAGNSGSKGDEKTQIRARLGVPNRMNGLGGPSWESLSGMEVGSETSRKGTGRLENS